MRRQLTRVVLTLGTSTLLVLGSAAIPAHAGEDKGLCNENHDRVKIPDGFPLPACFDGNTLYLKNDMASPLTLSLVGDSIGQPERYTKGASLTSRVTDFILPGDFTRSPAINAPHFRQGVVPPNYYIKVKIGNDKAKIKLGEVDSSFQRNYAITEALWKYVPGGDVPRALIELVRELADVSDQNDACHKRNTTNWGDAGCSALLGRNVVYAFGRAGISFSKEAIKVIVALLDAGKWGHSAKKDSDDLKKGDRDFTIAAYEPPVQDRPKDSPEPPKENKPGGGNSNNNSGGTSGGNNNPPPQKEEKPPPAPRTATAVVQNMHLEGGSGLGEDGTPSYLSSEPQPRCASNGCKLDGTDMWSGDTFKAICWTTGATMTNENRNRPEDDNNPNRIDTDKWLKGERNGKVGLISYIYLTPGSRNLGLAHC